MQRQKCYFEIFKPIEFEICNECNIFTSPPKGGPSWATRMTRNTLRGHCSLTILLPLFLFFVSKWEKMIYSNFFTESHFSLWRGLCKNGLHIKECVLPVICKLCILCRRVINTYSDDEDK